MISLVLNYLKCYKLQSSSSFQFWIAMHGVVLINSCAVCFSVFRKKVHGKNVHRKIVHGSKKGPQK